MWCLGLFLSALILVNQANGNDVPCRLAKNETLCKCYKVPSTPWPTGTSAPATHPEKVVVKFVGNRTKERSAHIQWTQKAKFLTDVQGGFYLELSIDFNLNYYYNCDVEIDTLINATNQPYVTFHFDDCCDSLKEGWKPKMELSVIVHARPMYNIDDNAYHERGEATVPDDEQSKDRKSKPKRNRKNKKGKRHHHQNKGARGQKRKTEELGLPDPGGVSVATLILACVTTFLVCTLIFGLLLILYIKCREKKPNELKDRSILVVCDTDERYIPFINQFVETLKKCGTSQTKITANVRKTLDIAKTGIIRWANDNINDADAVIFIVTEAKQLHRDASQSTEESRGCSHVSVALNVAESMTKSFRTAQKKFILLDIFGSVKFNSQPFCTYYTLNKGCKKLMKHALDLHYRSIASDDDYSNLCKLAASAESMPTNNETLSVVEQRGVFDGVGNNLDNSILYADKNGQARPLLRPNIAQDQFPSVENNELG